MKSHHEQTVLPALYNETKANVSFLINVIGLRVTVSKLGSFVVLFIITIYYRPGLFYLLYNPMRSKSDNFTACVLMPFVTMVPFTVAEMGIVKGQLQRTKKKSY